MKAGALMLGAPPSITQNNPVPTQQSLLIPPALAAVTCTVSIDSPLWDTSWGVLGDLHFSKKIKQVVDRKTHQRHRERDAFSLPLQI
jgi:hypothetical protein